MIDAIIVALITAGGSILATALTVSAGNRKTEHTIQVNQAVQDTKLEELTREVREHNKFAERIPQVETRVGLLEDRVGRLEAKQ